MLLYVSFLRKHLNNWHGSWVWRKRRWREEQLFYLTSGRKNWEDTANSKYMIRTKTFLFPPESAFWGKSRTTLRIVNTTPKRFKESPCSCLKPQRNAQSFILRWSKHTKEETPQLSWPYKPWRFVHLNEALRTIYSIGKSPVSHVFILTSFRVDIWDGGEMGSNK